MAELPVWQALESVPAPVSRSSAGRFVAVVASERAVSRGWAPEAVVDLVRRWADSGQRVVLVDGGLNYPSLHTVVGIANREGLSDATLHGASVEHVSRSVDGGAFYMITAGSPVADPHSVVRSSRWYRFCSGFGEAGVTLALYVRDGDRGASAFLGSVSDIIVLAEQGEPPPNSVQEIEPLVRAVAGPSGTPGAETGSGAASATPDPVRGAPSAEDAESAASPVEGDPLPSAPREPRGRSEARPVPAPSGGFGRMAFFVALAMLAAAALGWFLMSSMG